MILFCPEYREKMPAEIKKEYYAVAGAYGVGFCRPLKVKKILGKRKAYRWARWEALKLDWGSYVAKEHGVYWKITEKDPYA